MQLVDDRVTLASCDEPAIYGNGHEEGDHQA
jgi:hypothetical protein